MKNNAILFCFIAIWFASCADNKPAAEIPAIDIEANLFNMEEISLDILYNTTGRAEILSQCDDWRYSDGNVG